MNDERAGSFESARCRVLFCRLSGVARWDLMERGTADEIQRPDIAIGLIGATGFN